MRCARCETLVRRERPAPAIARVVDDDAAFYGREYWFTHQEGELGCPNILLRTRADLPERCLHWLRTVLRYKLPPARTLELGSGPGGFVALLAWAGFDASGLELSPWVVEFVRDTFRVPMLLGPVEDQAIEPGSLDLIAAMDVLEHLPDPVGTMRHCVQLLKPDGILLIQTPRYPEGQRHEELVADGDRFLEMLRPRDHLHLFSREALRRLFGCVGAEHIAFEPAMFAEYDMFAMASRMPPTVREAAEIDAALSGKATGRMVQALMDLDADRSALGLRHAEAEADRVARLAALEAQGRRLGEAEGERNALRTEVTGLRHQLADSEADRTARLDVIERQGKQLGAVEAERNELRAEVTAIRGHLETAEADRAARLEVIGQMSRRLAEVESQQDELRAAFDAQGQVLKRLQDTVQQIRATRAYRVLRRLGRWSLIAQGLGQSQEGSQDASAGARTAEEMRFDAAYASIREPKKKDWILYGPGSEDKIAERLESVGFNVHRYEIDVADFRSYFAAARYLEDFPDYYASSRAEKSLEHYLAAKLLQLNDRDIYVDIASQHSPAPVIYERLYGVKAYRQDLAYPSGVHEDRIGGDAARLPVADGFATKMALHCSFEHFEGDSDVGFIRECGRVLGPGGAACIVPLYLSEEYAIQTDPEVAARSHVQLEPDAVVYGARGFANRFGRFYDPEHLAARLMTNAPNLTLKIYRIVNAAQVDPSCYARFAMLIRKPATRTP